MVFESSGKENNLLEDSDQDELGLLLIRNMTEKIEYTREENKNKLLLTLKRE